MITLPSWLYNVLLVIVFSTICVVSIVPVVVCLEHLCIRSVTDRDKPFFPYLKVTSQGKFIASVPSYPVSGAKLVTTVTKADEEKINRDLNDSVGGGSYRFFQVLSQESDLTQVSLEYPTVKDAKKRGWYSIRQGSVTPEKILSYGSGFAFLVLPLTIICGFIGCAIYRSLVKKSAR